MKFKFGKPEHGWMNVVVADKIFEISLFISDVPCDSINKLANILFDLHSGIGLVEVEFSLEPDFALWRFISKDDELELHVFLDSGRNNPIVFVDKRDYVIQQLYKSLKNLESFAVLERLTSHEYLLVLAIL